MAEFTLPKNSKITGKGRTHKAANGAGRVKQFKIYRYDPDSGENPRYDTFESISTRPGRWCSTRSSR